MDFERSPGKRGLIRNPVVILGNLEAPRREQGVPGNARRRWIIATAVVVAVVAVLVAARVLLRHYSSPEYIEKRLAAALGPGYRIDIGSSHYDPWRQSFVATDVSVVSDPSWPAPPNHDRPHTTLSFQAGAVSATGVNLRALRKGNIDLDEIRIDGPKVSIFVDRLGVPLNHPRPPLRLPHEVLMQSGKQIHIDKIRVLDGDIRFSERARDGARPGMFRFADLNATIDHLTNDATQREHPCRIDVQTLLANSGALKAWFEYDLSSRALRMTYHAAIGKMDATSLNELLVDLKGIRVNEGTIDATTVDIKMDGDVAAGTVKLLYHGLKFEIVDKDTHDQDVSDHLATWMQNWKTHSSNPEDKDGPPTVITIQRRREPDILLIKFVWETVREGVLRTLGVQSR